MESLIDRYPFLRYVLPVLTAFAVAVFFVRAAVHFSYTPDDTYIYLRTAVNLTAGDGFSFNPGESSYSVTGPLWALLVSAGTGVGLDPYIVAKGLDLTFAALSLLVFQLLVLTATGDRVLSVLAVVMLACDAWILRWAGSGMESSLALLLTLTAFRAALSDERLVAGTAAGLAALLRPEYVLLLPWLFTLTWTGEWRGHLRRWAWPLAINMVIVGGWWGVATLVTGGPFPATFSSKAGGTAGWSQLASTLWDAIRVAGVTQGVVVLVLLAMVIAFRRRLHPAQWRLLAILVGWPVILSAVYALLGVQLVSRYLLPALPLLTVGLFAMFSWLDLTGIFSLRRTGWMVGAVLALSITVSTVTYEFTVVPHVRDFTAGMRQGMKPIAYWIRVHADSSDEVLAPDMGLVGYLGQRRVWDPAGLATPSLRNAVAGHSYDEIMLKALYRSVVNPRFVIDRSRAKERLLSDKMRPIMTTEFPSMGVNIPDMQYVTLYEALR